MGVVRGQVQCWMGLCILRLREKSPAMGKITHCLRVFLPSWVIPRMLSGLLHWDVVCPPVQQSPEIWAFVTVESSRGLLCIS